MATAMPTIQVDLPKFEDYPKLKKIAALVAERVRLYGEEKRIKLRLKGDPKRKVTGLNYILFNEMRRVLPDGVKSVEWRDNETDERYCVTTMVGEKGRMTLDREALMSTPWRVKCMCGCGKSFETTLPPKVVEACTKEGAANSPSVSVRRIGGGEE